MLSHLISILHLSCQYFGTRWLSNKEFTWNAGDCLQCRRCGFDPWVRKIPCRQKWHATPVFLPGKSQRWKSLVGYSPGSRKGQTQLNDSVQFSSVTQSCLTLCNPMNRSMSGLPVHHQLPEFTQTHVHQVGDAIQPSHPLLSPFSSCPQSLPASGSNESTLRMRWPKYWSFSFNISPSNEHPGLISFRMDWLDLLAVQGTLKSLLQHHNSKASILRRSAFFIVQLSHPYMTTGKTIALTRRTKPPQYNLITSHEVLVHHCFLVVCYCAQVADFAHAGVTNCPGFPGIQGFPRR